MQKMRLSERSIAAQARKRRKSGVPARRMGQTGEDALTHGRAAWGYHKGRWDTDFDADESAENLQEAWEARGGRGEYWRPPERAEEPEVRA